MSRNTKVKGRNETITENRWRGNEKYMRIKINNTNNIVCGVMPVLEKRLKNMGLVQAKLFLVEN